MYRLMDTPSNMRPMQSKTLSDWSSLRIFSSLSSSTFRTLPSRVDGATRFMMTTGSCFWPIAVDAAHALFQAGRDSTARRS